MEAQAQRGPRVRLRVTLAGRPPIESGSAALGTFHGGREVLLRWLETQLGLLAAADPAAARVFAYAGRLRAAGGDTYRDSFGTDPWATSEALLARRDALRLAGWNGRDHPSFPALARDLARTEAPGLPPGEAERLEEILAALASGQRLPPHEVVLEQPPEEWPAAWRPVLSQLITNRAGRPTPQGPPGTALHAAQSLVLGLDAPALVPDGSLRVAGARSSAAACQAIAAMLAAEPGALPGTVVCCEDPNVALLFDRALARLGLPTMGAARLGAALPPLQVLPLVLEMLWKPVDPEVLLAFLTLPRSPVASPGRWRLAGALSDQPGLGSAAWVEAWTEITSPENDPASATEANLREWLEHPRVDRGQPLPSDLVADRCGKVAHWTMGQAKAREGDPASAREIAAYHAAAAQAGALRELVLAQGPTITGPQLERMRDAMRAAGADARPLPEAAGGPTWASTLAEVPPCERLIWLGAGTRDVPPSAWSPRELEALQAAGVDADDGRRALRVLREAERHGLARVRERLLILRLPEDAERRAHPVWLQLFASLRETGNDQPVFLEDALGTDKLAPWRLAAATGTVERPLRPRPLWVVDPILLAQPSEASPTELVARLACPLKWTLGYPARLKDRRKAIPPDYLTVGRFAHDILARALRPGPVPEPTLLAAEVDRFVSERLPLDAAPLAMLAKVSEATRLRTELSHAALRLATLLRAGGYQIKGMEVPAGGTLLGRPTSPWARTDCLLQGEDGSEAILDFKYYASDYADWIRDGRAVQLAVYTAARAAQGEDVHGAGYFILRHALLHTPRDSALRGAPAAAISNGDGIEETWSKFAAGVEAGAAWLQTGEVPARPLQPQGQWPVHAELVIDEPPKPTPGERQEPGHPCKYCNYRLLCGLEAAP